MPTTINKSFAYQFQPFQKTNLSTDIQEKVDALLNAKHHYWMHFENCSKNLQSQLVKKFKLPKGARLALFAEESRSRFSKIENGYVLILQAIDPNTLASEHDFPVIRCWISEQGILSISSGKIEALNELQKSMAEPSQQHYMTCFTEFLENMLWNIDEAIYTVDDVLNVIETELQRGEDVNEKLLACRQDILFLRRFMLPQRDAMIAVASKMSFANETTTQVLKELDDSSIRQVETIEMLRERAMILQDNIANQIAETANRRMYVLNIILLIFTPGFFIMGIFSMYVPIPGMNSHITWWAVLAAMIIISLIQYRFFKRRGWF